MDDKKDKYSTKVKNYIHQKNFQVVTSLVNEMNCDHKWREHGFGYKCTECNYYTGMNIDLNKIIKKIQQK